MLVPENQQQRNGHVISMYLATCGANGHLLGSDEKEIIYLVFGIIDLQIKEVSDQSENFFRVLLRFFSHIAYPMQTKSNISFY